MSALAIIEQSKYRFGQKLELNLSSSNTSRQKAEELLALTRNSLPWYERPRRGAGARIRVDKTALKDLGAMKLLEVMHAPEAMSHTEAFLGKPLFGHESEWSRARSRATERLWPYRKEAQALYRVISRR